MDAHNEPERGCRIGREGWDGGTVGGGGGDEGRDDEGQISSRRGEANLFISHYSDRRQFKVKPQCLKTVKTKRHSEITIKGQFIKTSSVSTTVNWLFLNNKRKLKLKLYVRCDYMLLS